MPPYDRHMMLPDEVQRYLYRLVERLTSVLPDRLVGIYGLGGLAFGDYRHGTSDLDVYVVVRSALDEAEKLAIAAGCGHGALPCPARRLELVVISAQAARHPTSTPGWE